MAEINSNDSKQGKGKSKKVSTKIDMTPMVDLAFLLITFFMLTTSMNKPSVMQVNMPDKSENNPPQPIKESKAMTIILGEDNKLFYYMGMTAPKVKASDYTSEGIRKIILQKNKNIPNLVILIKAMKKSRYNNMVDILDEMHITNSKRYAIMPISDHDIELTKTL